MRTEEEIVSLLLSTATEDDRIRAVILSGSRSNPNIEKDSFQDFDVIYFVSELKSYRDKPGWINLFGERIAMQMPNSMNIDKQDVNSEKEEITYLMLFKDLNRIDLKLAPIELRDTYKDSLNRVLLDKDHLFDSSIEPNDSDYQTTKPSQKEFSDCCNEFWWVSTYVAKGLARNEPFYAKAMLENPVRNMFMRLLAWHTASQHGFFINLGAQNRFLKTYISPELWTKILATYPDAQIQNIWNSLFEMTSIFHELAGKLSKKLELDYNLEEASNVMQYHDQVRRTNSNTPGAV
ncbi:MAG: aminoglycoside 6-adenylyltransferase [Cyanothece sp. SIO1E1]|nr:aminoglycoside 6-adenylyltransferase [Cyanothece sp. SIO1E1]